MNVVYWLFLETLSGVQIFFEIYFSKSHVAKLMAYFIHDFMYDRVSSNLNFNFISWQNICKKYVIEAEAATRGVL